VPANAVTLGIGVQIDQQSTQNALDKLKGFVDTFRFGNEWLKPAEELEHVTQRMAASMGTGQTQAAALRSEIFSLAETTKFGVMDIAGLQGAFVATGRTLDTFSDSTQQAFVHLSSTFDVAAEEMARASTEANLLGSDFGTLLGSATTFTKKFGLPGMFQALPELIGESRRTVMKFSESVVGSGRQVVATSMSVATAFAKTFGVSVQDALWRATNALDKLRSSSQQDADVFLGLSDGFSELTKSIMQSGVGIERSMNLVNRAGKGDLGSLGELASIAERMPSRLMRDRFMRQLQKELPEDFYALVQDTKALQEALNMQAAAEDFEESVGGAGVRSFLALGDSMRETTISARDMFNNVMDLGKAVLSESGVLGVFQDALAGSAETFKDWAFSIRQFMKSERFREFVDDVRPPLGALARTFLTFGTAVTTVSALVGGATGFSVLGTSLTKLGTMVPSLGRVFGTLGGALSRVGGAFGFVAQGALKLIGRAGPLGLIYAGFQGVRTAVSEMGAVLGDPNATGIEKFEALLLGLGKGIGKTFDTILLGIPSKIASVFFPDLERRFERGVEGIFKSSGGPSLWERAKSAIFGWTSQVGKWLGEMTPRIMEWGRNFGKDVGSVVGGALRDFIPIWWDGVKTVFATLHPASWIYKWLTSDDVVSATESGGQEAGGNLGWSILESTVAALSPIGDFVLELAQGAASGFLGAFGLNFEAFNLLVLSSLTRVGNWFSETWTTVSAIWKLYVVNPIKQGLDNIEFWFEKQTTNAGFMLEKLGEMISTNFSLAWASTKATAFTMAGDIANKFGEMTTAIIDQLSRLVSAFPSNFPGIQKLTDSLNAARASTSSLGESLHESAAQANEEYFNLTNQSEKRIDAIEAERKANVDGIDAAWRANARLYKQQEADTITQANFDRRKNAAEVAELDEQFNRAVALHAQEQQRATDARRAGKIAKSILDETLQALGEDATRLRATDQSARIASNDLQTFMREQSDMVAKEVARGAITSEQAADRLKEIAARALSESKQKLRAKEAAEVASAARGPERTPTGVTRDASAQMWKNIRAELGRRQDVNVTLSGDGELSRAIARTSKVRRVSSTGGM